MPRLKKTDLKPEPKDPKTVKHGCASCVHQDKELKQFPCNECGSGSGLWLYWEDAKKLEVR